MSDQIEVGTILHWKQFQFEDGTTRNKFFIVLGARPGQNLLFVIATSVPKGRGYAPGCNEERGYYHIPNGGRDVFQKNTWLLLMECLEVDRKEAVRRFGKGDLTKAGDLRKAVIEAVRDCLRRCDDVSAGQLALL